MRQSFPDNSFRRIALVLGVAVVMVVTTGLAIGYVRANRGLVDKRQQTADAAPESVAATCEEQVYFLLNFFMFDEAIDRLRDCPDAADGYELSHLAKETYKLLDVYREADVSHPLADLPYGTGRKFRTTGLPAEPTFPVDVVSPAVNNLVLYRRALAAYGEGNFPRCIELLERAGSGPPLEDYRLHLAALASFKSGDFGRVHEIGGEFSRLYRQSFLYADVRVLEAGAFLKQGLEKSALSLLNDVAEDMDTPEGKGRVLTAAAGIHAAAGRADSVIDAVLLIVNEGIEKGEDTTYAEPLWEIAKEIKTRNLPPEAAIKAGGYFLDAGRPFRALTILRRAVKVHPTASLQLHLAEAELAAGRAKDATKRFESLLRKSSGQAILREACLGKARSYRAGKKWDDAAKVYAACSEKYEDYRYVPLQELARMYRRAGEEEKALAVMKNLVARFPRLDDNDDFFRLLGRKAYLRRRYDEALGYYGSLIKYFPDSVLAPHALFWMGKIHTDRGDKDSALKNFSEIVEGFPYSYFYYRVQGSGPVLPPWRGAERDFRSVVSTVNGDIHLKNGYALLAAGMTSASEREFRAAAVGRESAVGISRALRGRGQIIESIKYIEKTVETDADWYRQVMASGALRELLFPTLYLEEVEAAAREFGADTAVIYAVIRQESRFDKDARSPSNALGLMQIIPSTGRWCAKNMRIRGFRTKKLYEPVLNVRMGTWYLKQMNEKFGSLPLALAAYNWGPGNLSRWQRKYPDSDIDRFVESLPRAEPRRYVKNCLLNFYVYQSINKTDSDL